jgi:hypothetical protein
MLKKLSTPYHLPANATSQKLQLPPPGYVLVVSDLFEGDAVDEEK